MSIGLMDGDMSNYILVPFNLEIMKLSAYFKKNRQIVILSPYFTPEKHQHFYYRKDWNDGIYPTKLLTAPNVSYGGRAFSSEYKALKDEIENCVPDPSIYSKMERIIIGNGKKNKKKIFNDMMKAEHCRLSLDGRTINPRYDSQFSNLQNTPLLMLHDYDLEQIDGSIELIQDILKTANQGKNRVRIGMKFPVQVNNGERLIKWTNFLPNSIFYSLQYNGVIDDDSFMELIGRRRERAIYSQLDYYVTRVSSGENDFVKNWIRKIFRQAVISRSYSVFFTLKYDEDFFFDKRWERVLDLINFFQNSLSGFNQSEYFLKVDNDTMYDFVSHTSFYPAKWYGENAINRKEAREIFLFVKERCPELFDDFYNYSFNSSGGKL